jgi:hypothetical protein
MTEKRARNDFPFPVIVRLRESAEEISRMTKKKA